MTVDTSHGYANEAERGGQDIYDDFKLEKKTLVSMVYTEIFKMYVINCRPSSHTLLREGATAVIMVICSGSTGRSEMTGVMWANDGMRYANFLVTVAATAFVHGRTYNPRYN